MTSLIDRRQNAVQAPALELERRLEAVRDTFGADWLDSGDGSVPALWARRDFLATNQLLWLGDAIISMASANRQWVKGLAKQIRRASANNRRGAMFELICLAAFSDRQSVRPTPGSCPGYDGLVKTRHGHEAAISIKNFGMSAHEKEFVDRSRELEQRFLASLRGLKRNCVDLRVIAKKHPGFSAYQYLIADITSVLANDPQTAGHAWQNDDWVVMSRSLTACDLSRSEPISYQITVMSPKHENESKNLLDKLDTAYANAKKHAADFAGRCRMVFLHLPVNASFNQCHDWTEQYLRGRPDSPIDMVMLYQPAVATKDNTSFILHTAQVVLGAGFDQYRNSLSTAFDGFAVGFFVGVVGSEPPRLQLMNDSGGVLPADNYYLYQQGHFYRDLDKKAGSGVLRNPAPGLFEHLLLPDGLELRGRFPPSGDLTLLD